MERTYIVEGMSCDHCVGAVSRAVGDLDGVTDVSVDLASGRVRVLATDDIDDDAVSAAVEDAGYALRR